MLAVELCAARNGHAEGCSDVRLLVACCEVVGLGVDLLVPLSVNFRIDPVTVLARRPFPLPCLSFQNHAIVGVGIERTGRNGVVEVVASRAFRRHFLPEHPVVATAVFEAHLLNGELVLSLVIATNLIGIDTLLKGLRLRGVLINQIDVLVNLVVGGEARHGIGRHRLIVVGVRSTTASSHSSRIGPCSIVGHNRVAGLSCCEELQIVEWIAVVGQTDITCLEVNGMVELEQSTQQRAVGTHLTEGPCRIRHATLQDGTHTDVDDGHVLLDKPQTDHHAQVASEHGIDLSHAIVALVAHALASLTLGIVIEVHQHEVETNGESTMGIDNTGIDSEVALGTGT